MNKLFHLFFFVKIKLYTAIIKQQLIYPYGAILYPLWQPSYPKVIRMPFGRPVLVAVLTGKILLPAPRGCSPGKYLVLLWRPSGLAGDVSQAHGEDLQPTPRGSWGKDLALLPEGPRTVCCRWLCLRVRTWCRYPGAAGRGNNLVFLN